MTTQPHADRGEPGRVGRTGYVALALACAVAALLAATSDVHVSIPRLFWDGGVDVGTTTCGSAYDVTLFERDGHLGGERAVNQDEIDAACVSAAGQRMVLAGLFTLGAAVSLVLAVRARSRGPVPSRRGVGGRAGGLGGLGGL
ncbi:hypothetical protein, partial [Intrasporangium sp.]|uniref:hypothetical protein n=1 Tax=Intrasporangium sp. TaxID=1925024 RepID=UPI00293B5573